MEPNIRQYIENLFSSAPKTQQAQELMEEIVRNTIERYHDLKNGGVSDGEAYRQAIDGVGDLGELIEELGGSSQESSEYDPEQLIAAKQKAKTLRLAAVALYIMCVSPIILLAETPLVNLSVALMFFIISFATGLIIYASISKYADLTPDRAKSIRKRALMKAIAVGLFISCPTPCIILADTPFAEISAVLMFPMIALGVVLLATGKGDKSDRPQISFDNVISQTPKHKALYRIIVSLIWVTASVVFILLSAYIDYAVSASWIIFLLAAALQGLTRAIFDYKEARE